MTFEQAQLYIKIFILQHYDENIEDVIPEVEHRGRVSDLHYDEDGDWQFGEYMYVFWVSDDTAIEPYCIRLWTMGKTTDRNFNILDYITLQEETL